MPVVVKMKGLSGFAFTLAISSRTIESGTVCARRFFVLLPGMFQVAPSSLSPRRVMPAAPPDCFVKFKLKWPSGHQQWRSFNQASRSRRR
jgi:hypothetical protein